MVREPDATMQPTPQDNQLMSQHRILSLKSQLRIEWRDQDGQTETEQPDHSTSSGDSVTSSTRMRFSAHTGHGAINANGPKENMPRRATGERLPSEYRLYDVSADERRCAQPNQRHHSATERPLSAVFKQHLSQPSGVTP
jgi:hypothetical protein